MLIASITLVPPFDDRSPITLTNVLVRSVTRSRKSQTTVFEVPSSTIEEPALADVGVETGSSVVVTTTRGQTYRGYVEVVAEGTDSRFYWCGLAS